MLFAPFDILSCNEKKVQSLRLFSSPQPFEIFSILFYENFFQINFNDVPDCNKTCQLPYEQFLHNLKFYFYTGLETGKKIGSFSLSIFITIGQCGQQTYL